MSTLEQALLDEILAGQLDLLRFEAGVRADVLRQLERLRRTLRDTLLKEDLTQFKKQRAAALLKETDAIITRHYAQMQKTTEGALTGMAQTVARQTVSVLKEPLALIELSATLPSRTYMAQLVGKTLLFGAVSRDWWAKQAADTAFRFSNAVRQGLLNGNTSEEIVRSVIGTARVGSKIWSAPRSNIRALVHSSIQAVSAAARRETYRTNKDLVKGIRQHSTFDSHTSEICIAYSGQEWDIDTLEPLPGSHLPYNGGVPRHWNCRSAEIPIMRSFRELGIDLDEAEVGTRASSEGQIKADTTFEQWLSRRTKAQQDEQLGAGRAELWREGKITLEQLLSFDGNPLTLAQLEEKYG